MPEPLDKDFTKFRIKAVGVLHGMTIASVA